MNINKLANINFKQVYVSNNFRKKEEELKQKAEEVAYGFTTTHYDKYMELHGKDIFISPIGTDTLSIKFKDKNLNEDTFDYYTI